MSTKSFKVGDVVIYRNSLDKTKMTVLKVNGDQVTTGYFVKDKYYTEINPLSILKPLSELYTDMSEEKLKELFSNKIAEELGDIQSIDSEVGTIFKLAFNIVEPHTNNKLHPVSMVPIDNHVDFNDIKIWE